MILKKLTLHKCIRFKFYPYETLTHNFDTPITTLIGSIGSGKTSFLTYTLPNMVNNNDFKPGGYRILEFEHNDSNYVISNGYLGKNKHSILKDGIELNTSLRSKTFNEIIRMEMVINPTLWNVIVSLQTFTEATPMVRKEWFNILSPTDYKYGLDVFKSITTSLRDYRGAKKIALINLTKAFKVANSEIRNLEIELNNIDNKLKNISEEKLVLHIPANPPIEVQKHALKALTNKIQRMGKEIEENGSKELGELETEVIDLKAKSISLKEELSTINKHLDIEATNRKTLEARKEISILSKKLDKGITISNWTQVNEFLLRYGDKLLSLIEDKVTPNEYIELPNLIDNLNNTIDSIRKKMDEVSNVLQLNNQKLTILQEALKEPDINCPKCNHSFNPKGDISSKPILEESIVTNTKLYNELKDKLNTNTEKIKVLHNKLEATKDYNSIMLMSPNGLKIDTMGDINTLKLILNKTEKLIPLTDFIKSNNIDNIEDTNWDSKLIETQANIKENDDKLSKVSNLISIIKNIDIETKNLEVLKEKHKIYEDYLINYSKVKELRAKEDELLNKRNELNSRLNSLIISKNNTDNLNREISDLDSKISGLVLLSSSLSPKEGLIAKSINSFVGGCVDRMNKTIASILDYDMKIMMPSIEESGLTYRFPVIMSDGAEVKDVSSLSSGQKELVNVSWLLVVHSFLGTDMPLYLDEFGNRLDQHHKVKAFEFVSKIGESGKQIVMITHFKEGKLYGAGSKNIQLSENTI